MDLAAWSGPVRQSYHTTPWPCPPPPQPRHFFLFLACWLGAEPIGKISRTSIPRDLSRTHRISLGLEARRSLSWHRTTTTEATKDPYQCLSSSSTSSSSKASHSIAKGKVAFVPGRQIPTLPRRQTTLLPPLERCLDMTSELDPRTEAGRAGVVHEISEPKEQHTRTVRIERGKQANPTIPLQPPDISERKGTSCRRGGHRPLPRRDGWTDRTTTTTVEQQQPKRPQSMEGRVPTIPPSQPSGSLPSGADLALHSAATSHRRSPRGFSTCVMVSPRPFVPVDRPSHRAPCGRALKVLR